MQIQFDHIAGREGVLWKIREEQFVDDLARAMPMGFFTTTSPTQLGVVRLDSGVVWIFIFCSLSIAGRDLCLRSVHCYGFFRIWPAAGANDVDKFFNIKGNVTEGNTKVVPLTCYNGILRPMVRLKPFSRKLPMISKANTPRIEIPSILLKTPYLLRMGMPSTQQLCVEAAKQLAYNFF